MDRSKKSVVFLDTHIVIWLYEGRKEKFSPTVRDKLESANLFISPLVKLELQFLYEIERITERPEKILSFLEFALEINISTTPFSLIVEKSLDLSFTRDPFDRMILAEALAHEGILVSADREIKKNSKAVFWE
jgi:PIN domain nuclease of toxin-antitoxin system